jgi:probable rRNA maturation factor
MIEFNSVDVAVPDIDQEHFKSALSSLVLSEKKILGDISIVACSDGYLLEMNMTYLKHDYLTDIITFDYCEGNIVSGDLFVSIDRMSENARDLNIPIFIEFARVCAHGVLHLCGYKDKTEEESQVMRLKEEQALGFFGFT